MNLNLSKKKNYIFSLSSSFFNTFLITLIGFISVPISLEYWGQDRYAIFAILNSLIVYLSVSNLGINTAATILISKNTDESSKVFIFKRCLKLLVISVSLFLFCFIIFDRNFKGWINIIGHVPEILFNETYKAMFIMVMFFLINTIFSLIDSLYFGFKLLYVQKFFDSLNTILNFVILLTIVKLKGSMGQFMFLMGAAKLLISIFKIVYFKYSKIIKSESEGTSCKDSEYKNILKTSLRSFLLGLVSVLVWNTDNFVISHLSGMDSVTPYSITFKLFSILYSIIFLINTSIMPLVADEYGKNNWNWINKIHKNITVIMGALGGLLWIGGVLFAKDIILLWSGEKGYAGYFVVFFLGGYSYILSIVNLNSNLVSTLNYIKGIYIIGIIEVAINLSISILLIQPFGLSGVALGTFAGSLLSPFIILPIILKRRSNFKLSSDMKQLLLHFVCIVLPFLILSAICFYIKLTYLRIIVSILIVILYILINYFYLPSEITEKAKVMISKHLLKRKRG